MMNFFLPVHGRHCKITMEVKTETCAMYPNDNMMTLCFLLLSPNLTAVFYRRHPFLSSLIRNENDGS
jgi:hypothetical protein